MSNSAKNNEGISGYRKYILGLIEQSQLESENNDVDVSKNLEDKTEDFTEKGTDFASDEGIDANPEFEKFPETNRFAKSHEFPDETKDQGEKVRGSPKYLKGIDDTAKGSQ